jgi:hypothetical protein
MEAEEIPNKLAQALAEHFDCDPTTITSYVIALERKTDDGLTISWAWSSVSPAWALFGLIEWVRIKLRNSMDES